MRNKDFLSSGDVERNSLINRYAIYIWRNIKQRFKIKIVAWVIACFSLLANLTLIVMKYVNPILSNTMTTSLNIIFILILFICFIYVYFYS